MLVFSITWNEDRMNLKSKQIVFDRFLIGFLFCFCDHLIVIANDLLVKRGVVFIKTQFRFLIITKRNIFFSMKGHILQPLQCSTVDFVELRRIFTQNGQFRSLAGQRVLIEDELTATEKRILAQVKSTSVHSFGWMTHVEDLTIVVHTGKHTRLFAHLFLVDPFFGKLICRSSRQQIRFVRIISRITVCGLFSRSFVYDFRACRTSGWILSSMFEHFCNKPSWQLRI